MKTVLSSDTITASSFSHHSFSVRLLLCKSKMQKKHSCYWTGQKFIGFLSALHAEEARECSASFQVLSWNFLDWWSGWLLPKLLSSSTSTTKLRHTYLRQYLNLEGSALIHSAWHTEKITDLKIDRELESETLQYLQGQVSRRPL